MIVTEQWKNKPTNRCWSSCWQPWCSTEEASRRTVGIPWQSLRWYSRAQVLSGKLKKSISQIIKFPICFFIDTCTLKIATFHHWFWTASSHLTSEPRRILQNMSYDDIPLKCQQEFLREAASMGSKFEDIFLKFADTHHAINHARALSPDELKRVGNYSTFFFTHSNKASIFKFSPDSHFFCLQTQASRFSWPPTERASLNAASLPRCTCWRIMLSSSCPGLALALVSSTSKEGS